MAKKKKSRVNLYIDEDLLEFGKKLAFVKGCSLSNILEGTLWHELDRVKTLNDPELYFSEKAEESLENYKRSIEYIESITQAEQDYLRDLEEAKFCQANPEHPRAKLRLEMLEKQRLEEEKTLQKFHEYQEKLQERKHAFIERWNKTFK